MGFIMTAIQFMRENGLDVLSWVAGIIAVLSFLADAKSGKGEKKFKFSLRSSILILLTATCISGAIVLSDQAGPTDDPAQTENSPLIAPDHSNETNLLPVSDDLDGNPPDSGVSDNDVTQNSESEIGNGHGDSGSDETSSIQTGENSASGNSSSKGPPTSEPPAVTVAQVVLNYTSLNLMVNETYSLLATVLYTDGTFNHTASWISSNPAVASVDSTGKITALSAGTAQITAQASRNNMSEFASCFVTVAAPPVAPTGYSIRLSTDHAITTEPFRLYIIPYEDNVTQIIVHTISPSGIQSSFPLSADGKYMIDTEVGTWTIYASVSNEAGTYTASKESDYVQIKILSPWEMGDGMLQGLKWWDTSTIERES